MGGGDFWAPWCPVCGGKKNRGRFFFLVDLGDLLHTPKVLKHIHFIRSHFNIEDLQCLPENIT